MEKARFSKTMKYLISPLVLLLFFGFHLDTYAAISFQEETEPNTPSYLEYKGVITDSNTNTPLAYADLTVNGTNIRTVTNREGEFLLKVPNNHLDKKVTITFLGYETKEVSLQELKQKNNKITLDISITQLSQINIKVPKDAEALVKAAINRASENYQSEQTIMTAFYRETIKKRKKNASLSEAVVKIYKQPYKSTKNDGIKLIKSRKNTNYSRLDTLALKLQGGPFSTLYADIVKYPKFIFTEATFPYYEFNFEPSTEINNRQVYVVKFQQLPNVVSPFYYGKLYIDAETFALTSAVYSLNVENREQATALFVRKKPRKVTVYPIKANYRVDYKSKNGKWYYGYSNIQLAFKVKWKNKLFSSNYTLDIEMAITDWEKNITEKLKTKYGLKPSVILSDEASGFSDPEFWGKYNIIEPEKSIESAIKKIVKQLARIKT